MTEPSLTDQTPVPPPSGTPITKETGGTPIAKETGGAPVVKKTERPHPLTPFIRGWLVLVALVLGLGRQLVPNGEPDSGFNLSDLRWLLPVFAGIVVLAAVGGFFSWYFTRFVIDDEELRIETGVVFKNSKKVPFERLQSVDIIQPLAARMFGLAELRLEAGAGNSTIKLRYLTRANASRLRDYLLTRAHGHAARFSDSGEAETASVLTDLGRADRPLVTVSPARLVGGFVLSTEWLITTAIAIVVVVVSAQFAALPFALPGLIPLFIGAVSMIGRRLVAMFHFTLAESARGLRITRGLTNLTSQSVPIDRIQGIKISQPILWKPLGWYRVDVDILGYHHGDGENNESDATSVLLPVATAPDVDVALDRVLPGVDLASIPLTRAPRRAAWVRWYDVWTLCYGFDDRVLVTENGWFTAVRNVVPHAKTQSVRIEQGPLQRLLRLADVHVDTPKGPVNAVAHQVDAAAARSMALSQLDRARAARAADLERVRRTPEEASENDVLTQFGIGPDRLLGSGAESRVYALDDSRVLRIYRLGHEAPEQTIRQLRGLYAGWSRPSGWGAPPIEIPQILDAGERGGRRYTVDRRFSGRNFSGWLAVAEPAERRTALLSFLEAANAVHQLPVPVAGFARLVGDGAPQTYPTLAALLNDQLQRRLAVSRARLSADVAEIAQVWQELHAALAARRCQPAVVHGDFWPPNAYVSRGPDGEPVVTGIGDFSPHTMLADPLMDLAGAVIFLELESYDGSAADAVWLEQQVVDRWGVEVARWISVYRWFYGFYLASAHRYDPNLYAWCVRQLTRTP